MQKINIDVTKIDKAHIMNGKYLKLNAVKLDNKEIKLKQDKTPIEGVKNGIPWKLMKTHLIYQEVKNEDGSYRKTDVIGEATEFESQEAPKTEDVKYPEEDISPNDIPF